MKKLLLFTFLFSIFSLSAQVTNEGQPLSWKVLKGNEKSMNTITLPSFDVNALKRQDEANEKTGNKPWRFGYMHHVDYDLNDGQWTTLENGDRIWRIKFNSPGALSLNVIFDMFYMPEGGKVYLYNDDRTDLLGAYTSTQNQESGILGTWLVKGETLWIEYLEPANAIGQGKLNINKITHGYRSAKAFNAAARGLEDSGDCNQDVDCPIGTDWEDNKNHNKKAVGLLLSGGASFCTGALINNTNNDGTPYFLTANHCYSNPAAWSFRFGWISPNPDCATSTPSTNGPTTMTVSGATLRARNAGSDFCLVEINSALPSAWNRTYSGWSRSTTAPPYVVGIHHPAGDIMKICRDNSGVIQDVNAGAQTWEITTAGGGWELGVTEGGSSGSPLYNDQGNIIGQLFGGGAACSGTNDNGLLDYYGRLDVSWDGTSSSTRLKDWLDPTNSNQTDHGPFPSLTSYNLDASVSITVPDAVCGTVDVSPYITLTNQGTTPLTSASVSWNINGGSNTALGFAGSLNQYESTQINIGSVTVADGNTVFNVILNDANGVTDENSANDTNTDDVQIDSYDTTVINMSLTTDNYCEETSWEFRDSANNVLYSGGPYQQNVEDNTTFTETFTVALDECYTFILNDAYGDGICCTYGNGAYELTDDANNVIVSGGSFGTNETTEMSVREGLSVNDVALANEISVYPNPVSDGALHVSVKDSFNGNVAFDIVNILGQSVKNGLLTNGTNTINVSGLESSLYFVKIKDLQTNRAFTEKIVIN